MLEKRDPRRIDPMLNTIRELWNEMPQQRFCQLIMNSLMSNKDPYYIEDDELMEHLKELQKKIKH